MKIAVDLRGKDYGQSRAGGSREKGGIMLRTISVNSPKAYQVHDLFPWDVDYPTYKKDVDKEAWDEAMLRLAPGFNPCFVQSYEGLVSGVYCKAVKDSDLTGHYTLFPTSRSGDQLLMAIRLFYVSRNGYRKITRLEAPRGRTDILSEDWASGQFVPRLPYESGVKTLYYNRVRMLVRCNTDTSYLVFHVAPDVFDRDGNQILEHQDWPAPAQILVFSQPFGVYDVPIPVDEEHILTRLQEMIDRRSADLAQEWLDNFDPTSFVNQYVAPEPYFRQNLKEDRAESRHRYNEQHSVISL